MYSRFFYLMVFLCFFVFGNAKAQEGTIDLQEKDSGAVEPVVFTPKQASEYLMQLTGRENFWRKPGDTLQISLHRLLQHYNEPFESVRKRLLYYPFEDIELKPAVIVFSDTVPVRWLDKYSFIIDTIFLERNPVITQKNIVMRLIDPASIPFVVIPPDKLEIMESMFQVKDTITTAVIDTLYLKSKNIQIYMVNEEGITPAFMRNGRRITANFLPDSTKLLFSQTKRAIVGGKDSPFYIVPGEQMTDSLAAAVESLLSYSWHRDSIPLNLRDFEGRSTPFWLTGEKEGMVRYWVKNSLNDSITIWIGNPSKYDLTILLEEGVNVERKEKKSAADIPFTINQPSRELARLSPLKEIPVFWDYGLVSSFSLNQNYLSNWARGGESSLSSLLDITGRSEYTNKETKVKWASSGRLRYGTIRTKEHGSRKNTDLIELTSQYNKVLREKLDFSSVFYFKTQVAKGYNYPNDSVPVSRFLNPGTFTIGVGMEYKPNRNTSINFSPLSYKNTFVLDTAMINQTLHGIERDKRSRQEMGGQLVVKNSLSIFEGMNITNQLRLFSGYLNKPQNVDVDWELNMEKQISWYFRIRLNLHLIYDDDIRFPVLDADGQPVILPDGSRKREAKTQLNQFLGLTLSFRI